MSLLLQKCYKLGLVGNNITESINCGINCVRLHGCINKTMNTSASTYIKILKIKLKIKLVSKYATYQMIVMTLY